MEQNKTSYPEFGYFFEKGVGLDYMGIWKVSVRDVHEPKWPNKWRSKEMRVIISKIELIWYMNVEHKPRKREGESELLSVARSQVAFSLEEAKIIFDKYCQFHSNECQKYITMNVFSLQFFAKEIEKLTQSISDCNKKISTIKNLEFPDLENKNGT